MKFLVPFIVLLFTVTAEPRRVSKRPDQANAMRDANNDDINIVRKGWTDIYKNKEEFGVNILSTFIENYNGSSILSKIINAPEENIANHPAFRKYASILMEDLGQAIAIPKTIEVKMMALGQGYAKLGVTQKHISDLFKAILDEVKAELKLNKRDQEAWKKLLDQVSKFIKSELPEK